MAEIYREVMTKWDFNKRIHAKRYPLEVRMLRVLALPALLGAALMVWLLGAPMVTMNTVSDLWTIQLGWPLWLRVVNLFDFCCLLLYGILLVRKLVDLQIEYKIYLKEENYELLEEAQREMTPKYCALCGSLLTSEMFATGQCSLCGTPIK